MTATSTAAAIGTVAGDAISNSINTGLAFLSTSSLITPLIIGALAFIFVGWVMRFLHLR